MRRKKLLMNEYYFQFKIFDSHGNIIQVNKVIDSNYTKFMEFLLSLEKPFKKLNLIGSYNTFLRLYDKLESVNRSYNYLIQLRVDYDTMIKNHLHYKGKVISYS